MRKMNKEERKQIEYEITKIMQGATSSEYARYILEQEDYITGKTFIEHVIQDVMETSAWDANGYYNDDDIQFAIGRELMARLGVEF